MNDVTRKRGKSQAVCTRSLSESARDMYRASRLMGGSHDLMILFRDTSYGLHATPDLVTRGEVDWSERSTFPTEIGRGRDA